MKTISLSLPYPISANRYWQTRVMNATSAGGRPMATTYITADAKKFRAQVQTIARAAGVLDPIPGRVQLEIWLYPHRPLDWKTRMKKLGAAWDDSVQCIDLGNAEKVLSDALKNLAMEDDKWIRRIASQRMEPDEHGARVIVRITKIDLPLPQLDLLV